MGPGACIYGTPTRDGGKNPRPASHNRWNHGFHLFQRPDPHLELVGEGTKFSSCKKILKFGRGCGDTAHDFVAPDAGKHDPIVL